MKYFHTLRRSRLSYGSSCVQTVEGRYTSHGSRDEKGASLILALIFIVAVSLIVGGLTDWAVNDLGNTRNFQSASSLNYAASSVTELAIQSIRSTPLGLETENFNSGTPVPGYCWAPAAGLYVSGLSGIDGYNVAVWCSTVEVDRSPSTRTVTFWACKESSLSAINSTTAAQSAGQTCMNNTGGNLLLTAVVIFDDYPQGGGTPLHAQCTSTCGEGATTTRWQWTGS